MPRHILVVDLEATCDDRGAVSRSEMETIEIGAVAVAEPTLQPVAYWQTFVRPVRHPQLTAFCTTLTSITQVLVDDAPKFPEAFDAFRAWMGGYEDVVWASWGAYDRNQLRRDCDFHGIPYAMPDHLNLKDMFSEQLGLRKRKGVMRALRIVGLEPAGTHHRGIDDARNIARLLPFALGRKGPRRTGR
jgi:inhibitor of KinA sporulation pathway (predicted exonuclease)